MSPSSRIDVAVIGATGYTGRELCRLLLGHPAVRAITPTARNATDFALVHPNLSGCGLDFVTPDDVEARADDFDIVFFCTPSGEAMRRAGHFRAAGVRIVDLSADFRFADPQVYRRVHGIEHVAPELLAEARYGVTELHRADIAGSGLVANPGCYAMAAILGLAPLLCTGMADLTTPIALHAVNGTTGAGSSPQRALLHAEMAGAVMAYGLDGHRHGPELEVHLEPLAGAPVTVDLNTAHGSFARGIHLQANVFCPDELTRNDLLDLYVDQYGQGHDKEFFVLVNTVERTGALNEKRYEIYPSLRGVVGSNFCHIGVDRDARGTVKVVSVIDNLVKGAAGSAVQNMNVMLGFDEGLGLRAYAL
ncbi:N-acetyl-gamma-glutamyl-phosphate reductase [Amycolatopsis sp. NPDC089917]|uniref:N-acetyl-gamma-glutamyl-phosphate reductase n=1 Tax=Amycolatopsis sp. NPDC089917 TaxID=3155187 RepID=UPI00341340D7